jgi:hypothetical protein
MPGYSGTALTKKLGLAPGMTLVTIGAPKDYPLWLGELPADAKLSNRMPRRPTAVHLFVMHRAYLRARLASLRKKLAQDGFVWVSWPKKASKVPTDVTEDSIREEALPMGFVDIKVCAVSDTWSGLKLVIRKNERRG